MMAYILENVIGVLALNEKGEIIAYKLFDRKVEKIAENILKLEKGQLIDQISQLVEELKNKKYSTIVVEDENLARSIAAANEGIEVLVKPGNKIACKFREEKETYASKLGVGKEEYRQLTYLVALEVTRRKVRKAAEKRDLFIAQAISAVDEVTKTINLFASRIREWYGLHFPEMDDIIEDHETYVRLVYEIGKRENYTKENLKEFDLPEGVKRRLIEVAGKSMGASITEFDLQAMRSLARLTLDLIEVKASLHEYIDEAMKEVAPNIRGLVGPLLGARLIALAGGLSKLATLPASTIQVLGAEKALFRALRTGGKPPKHGVIFQHPEIHRAPRWQRGKIARALAAKLAIAARIDAFTGEYKAEELKEELEKRIKEIKTLYAKPPVRKAPTPSKPRKKYRKKKKKRRR